MLRLTFAALLASSLFSCNFTGSGQHMDSHWDYKSTLPRMERFWLGYDAQQDGTYRDFQYNRKLDVEMTVMRHFLNYNPDNPNHDPMPSRHAARPDHSLLPTPWTNPLRYIHVEGVLLGAAAIPVTGGFFPLPIDSILGTVEEGGWDEFMHNTDEELEENEVITASVPASLGAKGEDVMVSTVTQTNGR
ncbi:MAG: hypothetical protein R3F33_16550 [Planctomycetota bacterium]